MNFFGFKLLVFHFNVIGSASALGSATSNVTILYKFQSEQHFKLIFLIVINFIFLQLLLSRAEPSR